MAYCKYVDYMYLFIYIKYVVFRVVGFYGKYTLIRNMPAKVGSQSKTSSSDIILYSSYFFTSDIIKSINNANTTTNLFYQCKRMNIKMEV